MLDPVLYLDGLRLSDLDRRLSQSAIHILEDSRAADGSLHRDYVVTKHRFDLTWEMLPWEQGDVPDGGLCASGLAGLDPSAEHTLAVYAEDDHTDYTVLITDGPDLELAARDASSWWYKVRLVLEEE